MRFLTFVVWLLLLTVASSVAAQSPIDSFGALGPTLSVGQTLRVRNEQGRTTQGTLVSIAGDELVMNVPRLLGRAQKLTFVERSVTRVEWVDPHWNGTLIGGAIGFGAALALLCAGEDGCSAETGSIVVLPALLAGGGIGYLIDFLHTTVVYEKPGQAGGITVMPLVQPQRLGLFARVRF